jgi:cytochrome c-type biogenesis protein CcmH/NrfG
MRGTQMLVDACQKQHGWSCMKLGHIAKAIGRPDAAQQAYAEACRLGERDACERQKR